MAANIFGFITSFGGSGSTGTTPPTSTAPTVSITTREVGASMDATSFRYSSGQPANIQITFTWSDSVDQFTRGDVQINPIDVPSKPADANFAGFFDNGDFSGSGTTYTMTIQPVPNSVGQIDITVLPNTARKIPTFTDTNTTNYGPLTPITVTITYDATTGAIAVITKPEVRIVVPTGAVYADTAATISFIWNSDIQQDTSRSIGSAVTDDIRIQNATPGVLTHSPANRFDLPITLSGQGTCIITVKADSETDTAGATGPEEAVMESFLFNTALTSGDDVVEGTNTVTICSEDVPFAGQAGTLIGTDPGAFKGISDFTLVDDELYGLAQIQRVTSGILNQGEMSRAVLFKAPKAGSTCSILKDYRYVTMGARSITDHNDAAYFFEGSHYIPTYGPFRTSTYDPRPDIGHLRSNTPSSSTITDHGLTWRSRLIDPTETDADNNKYYSRHTGMSSPMITTDNNLYLQSGYGQLELVTSDNWESTENNIGNDAVATRIDNWGLLKYGRSFDFRVPVLRTNNKTGYEVLLDLAKETFSYIGFDGNRFIFRYKSQPRATLDSGISLGSTSDITIKNNNIIFPNRGFIKIDDEIIQYTGRTGNTLTGITRGTNGTADDDHCPDQNVLFYTAIIDMTQHQLARPINLLSTRQDLQQFYNIINISYGDDKEAIARNETSILQNKPRELELGADLSNHESEWANWLADQYLNAHSPIRSILDIELKPTFYLKAGDFILLNEPSASLIESVGFQILSISQQVKPYLTQLQLRSIP